MNKNDFLDIIEKKQQKIIKKIIKKFPYNWTDNQLKTMQVIIKNTPRIRINNTTLYRSSILEDEEIIKNENFIFKLFQLYYQHNIPSLMDTCGYTYLNFYQNDNIVDAYGEDVAFEGFNFSKATLEESLFTNNNYTPFYCYTKKINNKIAICGGRHRMLVLKIKNFKKEYLCIYWDQMPQKIQCSLYLPTILIEKSLFLLKLNYTKYDEYFSIINITDATDLWLILKVLDKEISYIIDFYSDLLKRLNIIPPQNVMWKIKN